MPPVDGRPILGRYVVGINNVLDPERHAMQRAAGLALVQGACLGHDLLCIEILPGLHRGFALRNMVETGARHGFTGRMPAACGLHNISRGQGVECWHPSRRAHTGLPLAGVSLSCRQDLRRFREHAPTYQPWQGAERVPGFSAPHRCAVHWKTLDFHGWRMYFAGGSTLARPRPEGGQAQCRSRTYARWNGMTSSRRLKRVMNSAGRMVSLWCPRRSSEW